MVLNGGQYSLIWRDLKFEAASSAAIALNARDNQRGRVPKAILGWLDPAKRRLTKIQLLCNKLTSRMMYALPRSWYLVLVPTPVENLAIVLEIIHDH